MKVKLKRQDKKKWCCTTRKRQRRERRKGEKTAQKKADQNARVATVSLILDKAEIGCLKGQKLLDQVEVFRHAGAPLPKLKKDYNTADARRKVLQDCIDVYGTDKWVLKAPENENSQLVDEDDEDEDDGE